MISEFCKNASVIYDNITRISSKCWGKIKIPWVKYVYMHLIVVSGAGAVEYIICHAEISIVFVEETKISEVDQPPPPPPFSLSPLAWIVNQIFY